MVTRHAACSDCETVGPVTSVEVTWHTDPTTWGDLCGDCLSAARADMEVREVTVLPDELCADCGQTVAGVEASWNMATPYCPRCWELLHVE